MDRKIAVLGSTGSVGTQTLDVCSALGYSVTALSANRSVDVMEAQARKYGIRLAAMYDEKAAADLRVKLADTDIRVVSGAEGLCEAAASDADTVVTAVMGTVGLKPTMAAIREKKRIALANKETLVCAGRLVTEAAEKYGAEILPVDSEHSAIFQCIHAGKREDVERILLTCSGGPFRGWTRDRLEREATRERTLQHPSWSMGKKITVDCATLMNKGLEFIEAMWLFSAKTREIRVLVHPQSIVHSLVEYRDGSVIAQMGAADMRIPIQCALTWPDRICGPAKKLELTQTKPLTFEEPDLETFGCLALAMETAEKKGAACAVMNAANEAAVDLFLRDRIRFTDIEKRVRLAVEKLGSPSDGSVDEILAADEEARKIVYRA